MGYTRQAVKGFTWLSALRISVRSISFVRIAILARLLTPAQFGIFGVASIVLQILEIFTETGINIIIIQNKVNSVKNISTAWVVSILRGLLISIVIFLLAPLFCKALNAPEALNLVRLISVVPLLRGFINPSVAIFIKELEFNKEFYYRASIFLIEAITSITLVYLTGSASGMVWGLILAALYEILISFIIAKPRPNLNFDWNIFKDVIGRGKWITLGGIFNYLYHNLDNMIVVRLLGASQLGFYDMAYRISSLPITEVSDVVGKITLPVYIKISEDIKRLRKNFIKTTTTIFFLSSPIALILLLFPEFVINIVLGDKWLPASETLQVLAIFGFLQAMIYPMMTLLLSRKKQNLNTAISFVNLVGLGITIVPLTLSMGIVGAAWSSVIGTILSIPFAVYFTTKELKYYAK